MRKLSCRIIPVISALLLVMVYLPLMRAEEWQSKPANRQKINFNGQWLFYRGEITDDAAKNPSFADSEWQVV